jgi:hypothetical protein
MTDEKLLNALREWWDYDHGYYIGKAVERLEKLLAENAELKKELRDLAALTELEKTE